MAELQNAPATGIKLSLIQRLMGLFAVVFLLFFLLIGFLSQRILEQQVTDNMKASISVLTKDEGCDIEERFRRLENLGRKSAETIVGWIKNAPSAPDFAGFDEKYRMIDGALRTNVGAFASEDVSGVFVSNLTELTDEIKSVIIATEGRFDNYARGTLPFVFNMYLITRHQLIRIYAKDWALEIEPNHDFTKDIFYYIADPRHSPRKTPRWTVPYYDSIWRHWMISLVTPIYIDDEFFGIVGHDFILDNLYNEILVKKFFKTGYGFIFDANKNIIVHPHHLDRLRETAEMGARLRFSDLGDAALTGVISRIVEKNSHNHQVFIEKFHNGSQWSHLFAYNLDLVDWYFGIVVPEDEVVQMLSKFRQNFLIGASASSLVLFCVVVSIIWIYVVSPINKFQKVTQEVRKGNLDKKVAVKSHDEIGDLAASFNDMTDKLKSTYENLKKDISERRRTEEALRESEKNYKKFYEESKRAEEVYRSLIHSSADAIAIYDLEGRTKYVSPTFTEVFGWTFEALENKRVPFLPDFEREATQAIIRELVDQGKPCHGFETKRYTKDGRLLDVSISASRYNDHDGTPSGILVILRDISETKRLEFQLQHAQKMEAVGTLAGGIAHDFNNLMMGMLGNVSLMMHDMDASHPHYEKLAKIKRQIQSGSGLTTQLLGFARKGKYEIRSIDINRVVDETSETFGRTKKDVAIHKTLCADLLAVEADQGQIEQVLWNLFLNAADAMPSGGDLFLKTSNATAEDMKDKAYEPKPGRYVLFEIVDTGTGMNKKTMDRIFEPFFTTKEMGRGTGLGLASVYGIVKGHGGYIDVDSVENVGTAFSIYLPATGKRVPEASVPPEKIEGGSGTILIVDDEEIVLDVSVQMLEAFGYRVLEADSGERAIRLYAEQRHLIDLVIVDMVMPGISGGQVYDRIKEMNSGVKVLLSSGYSLDGQAKEIMERGCDGFIQKPFDMKSLSKKIKEILD